MSFFSLQLIFYGIYHGRKLVFLEITIVRRDVVNKKNVGTLK